MDFTTFFKKRIEPFLALAVLIVLIILAVQLYQGQQLRKEVNQNCGWGDENYRCFCQKSEVEALIYNNFSLIVDEEKEYVPMGG